MPDPGLDMETRVTRRTPLPSPSTPPGGAPRRGARVYDDARHDPYHPREKLAGPMRCTECGVVYRHGRWKWGPPAEGDAKTVCPACRRIADRLPAGELTLAGTYAVEHRDELLRLVRNQAEQEQMRHPMNRIMGIDVRGDVVEVATTDVHLPRRIGEALRYAHDGALTMTFGKDECSVRVHWER